MCFDTYVVDRIHNTFYIYFNVFSTPTFHFSKPFLSKTWISKQMIVFFLSCSTRSVMIIPHNIERRHHIDGADCTKCIRQWQGESIRAQLTTRSYSTFFDTTKPPSLVLVLAHVLRVHVLVIYNNCPVSGSHIPPCCDLGWLVLSCATIDLRVSVVGRFPKVTEQMKRTNQSRNQGNDWSGNASPN